MVHLSPFLLNISTFRLSHDQSQGTSTLRDFQNLKKLISRTRPLGNHQRHRFVRLDPIQYCHIFLNTIYILITCKNYNIDESHGIMHSMDVLNKAHNIIKNEIGRAHV